MRAIVIYSVLSAMLMAQAFADSLDPALPEPFTLEDAVNLSLTGHPAIRRAHAEQSLAEAEKHQARSAMGFTATASAHARYIEPNPVAADQSNDDSRLTLSLRKRLYDFGRSKYALKAADAEIHARRAGIRHAEVEQLLELIARYFQVVEADLAFDVANESMSIAFIRWDRLQDRQALGQVSDIAVEEADAEFNRRRVRVREAETRRRSARALLANAYNRPDALPSTVEPPQLNVRNRALDDFDPLLAKAVRINPELMALRGRLEAAEYRLRSAEAGANPILGARFDTGLWNRDLGGRDAWGAELVLEVPLFTGGVTKARAGKRRAELYKLRADLDEATLRIRQRLLEAWLAVDVNRARVQETQIALDYRDLYLDRSRALYELEARADLGDAMSQWSDAQLEQARALHDLAMAFARLDALTGEPVVERLRGIGIRKRPPAVPAE